jgi:acyl carrier protein
MPAIHDQIQSIARRVFKQDDLVLDDATTAADVEKWDSLTHIQFIVEVEKALAVKFRNAEIARLRCIGDLKKLVAKHRPDLAAAA